MRIRTMRISRGRSLLLSGCAIAPLAASSLSPVAAQAPHFAISPTNNITVATAGNGAGGETVQVTQNGARGVANWYNFNVGPDTIVNIDITGVADPSQAITLNRVIGGEPLSSRIPPELSKSVIEGRIQSPGQFWLINERGVYISASGVIDVAGFLASSANITDQDFLSGNTFTFENGAGGAVVNDGTVLVTPGGAGGYAVLSGAGVEHNGLIGGRVETVVLGGAEAFVLTLDGSGVSYDITSSVSENPFELFSAVEVNGAVEATGRVLLTASALNGIFDSVINVDGVVIGAEIVADASGAIVIAGALEASGDIDFLSGGSVDDYVVDGSVDILGAVEAGGDVSILSDGDASIEGAVLAGGDLSINSGAALISGAAEAGGDVVLDAAYVEVSGAVDGRAISVFADDIDFSGALTASSVYVAPKSRRDIYLGQESGEEVSSGLVVTQGDIDALYAGEIVFDAVESGDVINNAKVNFGDANAAQNAVFLFARRVYQAGDGAIASPRLGVSALYGISLAENRNRVGELAAESAFFSVDFANEIDLVIADVMAASPILGAGFSGWNGGGVHVRGGEAECCFSEFGDAFALKIDTLGDLTINGALISEQDYGGVLAVAGGDLYLNALASSFGSINDADVYDTRVVLASTGGEAFAGPNAVIDANGGRYLIFTGSPSGSDLGGVETTPWFNTPFDPNAATSPAVPGDRIVYRAEAVITLSAIDRRREYGDAGPDLSSPTLGRDWEFTGGLADYLAAYINGAPTLATNARRDSNVGRYTISIAEGSLNFADFNATVKLDDGNLEITPAPLTLSATGSREYGLANDFSNVSVTSTPLKLGQTLADVISITGFASNAQRESNVGRYSLEAIWTPLLAPGAAVSNYAISFANGSYAVTPATVVLVVSGNGLVGDFSIDDITVEFAPGSPPRFGESVSDIAVIDITTEAQPFSPAGQYGISVVATPIVPPGASEPNYIVLVDEGVLTLGRNKDVEDVTGPANGPSNVPDSIETNQRDAANDAPGADGLPRPLNTPVEEALLPGDDLLYRSTLANNGNDGIW